MKTLVAYTTKTGATEQYASWLGDALGAAVKRFEDVGASDLQGSERVFVLSGTYGGKMPLTKFLNDNWAVLEKKKVIAIAVGMAPEDNWWSKISRLFLRSKIRAGVKYYKLPGWIESDPKSKERVKRGNLDRILQETT